MALEARAKLGAEGDSGDASRVDRAPMAGPTPEAARGAVGGSCAHLSESDSAILARYSSAEDFFEGVREASLEAERTRLALMRMEAREGVRAQGYEAQGRSGYLSDRTAATDARMDYEGRMRGRLEEDYALIDLACRVLYGEESGKGGVDALMGSAVADAISFRYVDARPWGEVAALVGYSGASAKSLRDLCRQGFDCVDFLGWGNCLGGKGLAEG